jgi:hypothetical protein
MAGANPNNPNGVEKGFQDALSKFKLRLSAREYTSFKFTTLKDLRQEILRIQAKQALKSECMNLTRVEAFVEGFRQFGEVVEVFLNTSEFVALVWGPMKFILQVRLTTGLHAGGPPRPNCLLWALSNGDCWYPSDFLGAEYWKTIDSNHKIYDANHSFLLLGCQQLYRGVRHTTKRIRGDCRVPSFGGAVSCFI